VDAPQQGSGESLATEPPVASERAPGASDSTLAPGASLDLSDLEHPIWGEGGIEDALASHLEWLKRQDGALDRSGKDWSAEMRQVLGMISEQRDRARVADRVASLEAALLEMRELMGGVVAAIEPPSLESN